MLSTDKPTALPIPFGASAGVGYIRTIPTATQIGIVAGAASLTDGFVPLNATLRSAGGVPPSIKDMNGILFEATALIRWLSAGGLPSYDAAFQTGASGYPSGAAIVNASKTAFWVSTVDNNMTNPDAGGAGWRLMNNPYQYAAAAGTANAITAAFTPAVLTLTDGLPLTVHQTVGNTSSAPTLQADATAAHTIVKGNGNPLNSGDTLGMMELIYDLGNTRWVLQNPCTAVTTSPAYSKTILVSTSTVLDASASGAIVLTTGSGAITHILPAAATIKAGSMVEFYNLASLATTSNIVTRAGADTITAGATSGLTQTSAFFQGDMIKLMSDGSSVWYVIGGNMQIKYANGWLNTAASPGYQKMPSGLIVQWGQLTNSGTPGNPTAVTFPIAFPTAALVVMNTAVLANAAAQSAWTDTAGTAGFNSRALTASCVSQWVAWGV
jgi:hypothetical protein